jgi:hypothetical protein
MSTHIPRADADDRRLAYRCEPARDAAPGLSIATAEREVAALEVIDINAHGARAAFAPREHGAFRPGAAVTLRARVPDEFVEAVEIDARVVFSAIKDGRLVAGFCFSSLPQQVAEAGSGFFELFNRRRAPRDDGAEVTAEAVLPGTGAQQPVSLQVVNHSTGGIGFIVDSEGDALLGLRPQLEIVLHVPGEAASRHLRAEVCHRLRRARSVYYGCRIADAA